MRKKSHEISDEDMMDDIDTTISDESPIHTEKLVEFPDRVKLEQQLTETEQHLALLSKKLLDSDEALLRARADIENVRRRTELEVGKAHKFGINKLLEALIPVLDSLEQSITVESQGNTLVEQMRDGMMLTLQMLQKTLTQFGVKEIYPLNELFDPAQHEVMLAQPHAELPPNTVMQVLQKGYQLHERVIRPARVMIVKA